MCWCLSASSYYAKKTNNFHLNGNLHAQILNVDHWSQSATSKSSPCLFIIRMNPHKTNGQRQGPLCRCMTYINPPLWIFWSQFIGNLSKQSLFKVLLHQLVIIPIHQLLACLSLFTSSYFIQVFPAPVPLYPKCVRISQYIYIYSG